MSLISAFFSFDFLLHVLLYFIFFPDCPLFFSLSLWAWSHYQLKTAALFILGLERHTTENLQTIHRKTCDPTSPNAISNSWIVCRSSAWRLRADEMTGSQNSLCLQLFFHPACMKCNCFISICAAISIFLPPSPTHFFFFF